MTNYIIIVFSWLSWVIQNVYIYVYVCICVCHIEMKYFIFHLYISGLSALLAQIRGISTEYGLIKMGRVLRYCLKCVKNMPFEPNIQILTQFGQHL